MLAYTIGWDFTTVAADWTTPTDGVPTALPNIAGDEAAGYDESFVVGTSAANVTGP